MSAVHHHPPTSELVLPRDFAASIDRPETTVRSWIAAGHLTAYKVTGQRGVRLWPRQAREEIAAAVAAGHIRLDYGSYGPTARVVSLPAASSRPGAPTQVEQPAPTPSVPSQADRIGPAR